MAERPNILIIMSDQHNPHLLGCAGDRLVRTPNLDALATRGVRFERAYCGSPLCVPSRMTFPAGRTGTSFAIPALGQATYHLPLVAPTREGKYLLSANAFWDGKPWSPTVARRKVAVKRQSSR